MARLKVPKYDLNNLAVITVLFNPIKYKSRYEHYHKFDEHMSRSGVTLLTIECIFDVPLEYGLPRQKFEVTRSNDVRHLQIRAPSVLWLKENLINLAVRRLPESIEYVAWLDADIEFERLDWAHLTIHQLQTYAFVQVFELATFLGPSGKKQIVRQDYSFAYAMRHNIPVDPNRSSECYVHPGYGWAMRRSTFDEMNGLLDFSILGSGDLHFAFALFNRIDETIPDRMSEDYKLVARAWGEQVAQVSQNGDRVGYVPTNIWHYWHGNRVSRGYFERWLILEEFQFSPMKDLEKQGESGLIRLRNQNNLGSTDDAQRISELEKNIIAYFRSRDEDNIKRAVPKINMLVAESSRDRRKKIGFKQTYTVPKPKPQPITVPDFNLWPHNESISPPHIPENDERFSLTFELENDSFFNSRSYYNDTSRWGSVDEDVQRFYYEDENGNHDLTSPGEISF